MKAGDRYAVRSVHVRSRNTRVCAVLSGVLRDEHRTIKMNEGSKTDDGY
jgi:hypothetical protein